MYVSDRPYGPSASGVLTAVENRPTATVNQLERHCQLVFPSPTALIVLADATTQRQPPSLVYVDWDPHSTASTSKVEPTEFTDLTQIDEVGSIEHAKRRLVLVPHTGKTPEYSTQRLDIVKREHCTSEYMTMKQKTEHIERMPVGAEIIEKGARYRGTAVHQPPAGTTSHQLAQAVDQVRHCIEDANHCIKVEPDSQEFIPRYTPPLVAQNSTVAQASSSNDGSEAQIRRPSTVNAKAFNLPAADVQNYLADIAPFVINPPPIPTYVPRAFLRVTYGGNDQAFLQYIPPERNPSGPLRRRMVFPTLDLNPAMPSTPGAPGLVFASRHEILQDAPWTLFCKKSNTSPVVWLYIGEYENTLKGKMSKEQFAAQAVGVQREWARSLIKCKQFEVYVAMRARVALRLAALLPLPRADATEDEDDELKRREEENNLIQTEIRAIKKGGGRPISVDDLVAAFVNGDEGIDIIQMRCVGYDHTFASHMRDKLRSYKKPAPKRKA